MSDPLPPNPDQPPDNEADAELLFRDEPAHASRPASPMISTPAGAGGYDLEAKEPEPPPASRRPVAPAPPPAAPAPARPARPAAETAPRATPNATVEEVWSRWAEWGPTLIKLAVVGLIVAVLAYYFMFNFENPVLGLLILTVGGLVWVVLAYPIAITLERPVRITPEQAIKDYFGALAHHRPHFRRMWLLLSSAGRTCSEYGSLEGFEKYWNARLAALRGSRVGSFTPLVFQIPDFKAPKSAGQTTTEAAFTVVVHARGQQSEAPLASIRVQTRLVRGPDNQWYLNRGTLPEVST